MDNERINQWAADRGTGVILKHKYLFFAVIFILLVFGGLGTKKIIMDSSNESFLPENDETIIRNNRFKEIFGNEEFIFVLIEADDVFHHRVLKYIDSLSRDLEENLPFVKEVVSLTNVEYTESRGDVLNISDLIGTPIPQDEAELEKIKTKALAKKLYVDRLVSRDGKSTGIVVNFEKIPGRVYIPYHKNFSPLQQENWPPEKVLLRKDIMPDKPAGGSGNSPLTEVSDPRKLIAPALKAIIGRHRTHQCKVLATGVPVMDYEGEVVTDREGKKFGVLSLIASIVLLLLIFRSFTAVAAPFLVLVSTLAILYGLMGWLGIPQTLTSMIISPLILVISVSYSIHVINHFQHHFRSTGRRVESVTYAFRHSTWPCFLTAATTAVGFISFVVVPVRPIREMGLACAAGVFITYFLVMILVPCFYSFGKDRSPEKMDKGQDRKGTGKIIAGKTWMLKWADLVINRSKIVAVVSVLFLLVVILFSFQVRVDSDALKMMGGKLEFVRNGSYIAERLGGIYSFELLIELPEEGMAKNPEVLLALDRVAAHIDQWQATRHPSSILDIIKDLNMTMHGNDDRFFTIPRDRDLIAQYLLLYEMSGGEDIEEWIDFDYKTLRLSVKVSEFSSTFKERFSEIGILAGEVFPAGTRTTVVGDIPIMIKMMNMLTSGQIKSILAAFVVIMFMMMMILGSVKIGLLSMIPNVLPVVAITGLMGILDFPLDIMTVMIAPMVIGIAVDDTVHYMIHFKQEFSKCLSYPLANRETFAKVGRAILFTSVILAIGFSIMSLSAVNSIVHTAILSAFGITAALLADLLVTPVIFVYLKPFKNKKNWN